MIRHGEFYYYCESREKQRCIVVRKSRTITDIGADPGVVVWKAPRHARNSHGVWAPELHFLNGKWFIYYAADDGDNRNHRMWVLESETADPQGAYRCQGELATDGWAIDGTILSRDDGRRFGVPALAGVLPRGQRSIQEPVEAGTPNNDGSLFFVWSGWPGKRNGLQNLYIAPMSDPATISGPRVMICGPTERWERVGMPICEGPQVLRRDGKTFMVYSASGSWTPEYCLGLLISKTGDFLNPNDWEKRGPVFSRTEYVWGVGHCSFVKSPCQTEDWILYHSKSSKAHGWRDRDVHAKRFTWTMDGLPDFGTPPARTDTVLSPLTAIETASLLHVTPAIAAAPATPATTHA
ncbi:MAG: glycoside hydrolase family 43 protein [Verrucomicrobia subdivision 3 bacterium]|nr:glycoside hydrolase family 43 protein [Limisphaerales bacterium]